MNFHPLRNPKVLRTVVSANTARNTMVPRCPLENLEDRCCAVVVAGLNANYHSALAIHERVSDNLETNEA